MGWLRRAGLGSSREESSDEAEDAEPRPEQRTAPALAALFEDLRPGRGRALLDLGYATQAHLRLYGRFARWIRFAGLLPNPPLSSAFRKALSEVRAPDERPYDVVVAWNLLDWLSPESRRHLMERLTRITAPDARFYAVVDVSDSSTVQPLRFTPLDSGRVTQEAVGRPEPSGPQLLPAEMAAVLAPFRISRAFTLRIGMREYLAEKREEAR